MPTFGATTDALKAGIEVDAYRTYLTGHEPTLAVVFEDSVVQAAAET